MHNQSVASNLPKSLHRKALCKVGSKMFNVYDYERAARLECKFAEFCPILENSTHTHFATPMTAFGVTCTFKTCPTQPKEYVRVRLAGRLEEHVRFLFGIKAGDGTGEVIFFRRLKISTRAVFGLCSKSYIQGLKKRLASTSELTITCTMLKEEPAESKSLVSRGTQSESESVSDGGNRIRQYGRENPESEDLCILIEHFKDLLHSGDDHDVVIEVKNEQFKAHRCILRARSPVFAAMFRSNMEEKASGTITVDDCDPDAFKEFLQYVYTGKVDIPSANVALGLYYASDKYDFPRLKMMCVDFLTVTLSITTVSDVITLSAKHGEKELLQMAIYYFSKNLEDIIVTVEWQRFLTSNPIQANEIFLQAVQCLKVTFTPSEQ